jgi:hypothetical protein
MYAAIDRMDGTLGPGEQSLKERVCLVEARLVRHRRYIDEADTTIVQLTKAQQDFVQMGSTMEARLESMSEHLCHCNRPVQKSPVDQVEVSLEDDSDDLYATPERDSQRLPEEGHTR